MGQPKHEMESYPLEERKKRFNFNSMNSMGKLAKLCYWSFRKSFPIFQYFGVHVTPNHFYAPVPDTRTLTDDLWQKQSELVGIDINDEAMCDLLSQFSFKFKAEYETFPRTETSISYQYYLNNGLFESVDSEIYYCMVRYFKPKKIIEIGAGNSTFLAAQAILKNGEEYGINAELIVIEPYPNSVLRKGFPGFSKLIARRIQDVDLSEFSKLGENDILFIDSSHILKIGSDVHHEYLDILPRLNKGVLVHIHDIFLPTEYPKRWIHKDYKFWNEQYLLQAFLIFNGAFEVMWGGRYMQLKHPQELEEAFDSYNRKTALPSSFWMRKLK